MQNTGLSFPEDMKKQLWGDVPNYTSFYEKEDC